MGHDGNARGGEGLDDFGPLGAAFQLDGLATGLLENPRGVFDGCVLAQVKARKGHVNDDQGMLNRAADHLGVINHFIEGDGQGVLVALHNLRHAVAD